MLTEAVARHHGMPLHTSSVVVFTRPDIIWSNRIATAPLLSWSRQRSSNWLFLVRHQQRVGGFDPSELFFIGNWGYFDAMFAERIVQLRDTPRDQARGCWARQESDRTCTVPGGSHYWRTWFVHDAPCTNTSAFFLTHKLKIQIHRLQGSWNTGINRPVAPWTNPFKNITKSDIDVTKDLLLVRGRPSLSFCHAPRWNTERWHKHDLSDGDWMYTKGLDLVRNVSH